MGLFSLDIFKPTFPLQAIEISGGKVLGVCLEKTKTGILLRHFFCENTPEGVLEPTMIKQNVHQVEAFKSFLAPKLKYFTQTCCSNTFSYGGHHAPRYEYKSDSTIRSI